MSSSCSKPCEKPSDSSADNASCHSAAVIERSRARYFSFEAAPGGTDAAYGIDLSSGQPVLFGEANFGDPQGMFVARLENAYVFADGFESGTTSAW